jgi:hypothetical protein
MAHNTGVTAMSVLYDVRITRGGGSARIGGDEWLALIRSDESLLLAEVLEGRNPQTGEVVIISRPLAARWLNHPDRVSVLFIFEEGEIVGSWLDEPSVEKGLEIAAALQAEVVKSID